MSFYLQVGTQDGAALASNRGWSDVLDWMKGLPTGKFRKARHLGWYGWAQTREEVADDLAAALEKHPPEAHDVRDTVERMVSKIRGGTGTVVTVTNGMGPDDGKDQK